ncbi:hypothetical protein E2C01_070317 [Portunus trituberculatus]|uniref:Uncharacterized protein n=1 Tax=Portunus trituberculatus TaxID=210409 RepID=A0A5B7I367_PORTR|nr:hypothetical protein [Portunus trituberculatus]
MRPLLPAGGHAWSPLIPRYVYGLASCPLASPGSGRGEAGLTAGAQEGVAGWDV